MIHSHRHKNSITLCCEAGRLWFVYMDVWSKSCIASWSRRDWYTHIALWRFISMGMMILSDLT